MPKSSMAMRTPMSRSRARVLAAPATSLTTLVSVISSSSRPGGSRDRWSATLTAALSASRSNQLADALTATRMRSGHDVASLVACPRTHSPIWFMRPRRSAIGMNVVGAM